MSDGFLFQLQWQKCLLAPDRLVEEGDFGRRFVFGAGLRPPPRRHVRRLLHLRAVRRQEDEVRLKMISYFKRQNTGE